MKMPTCPICQTRNMVGSQHCKSCGADLFDPDVLAMAGMDPAQAPSPAEAGTLASDRFLGFSFDRLVDGSGLGRLAALGAGLALVGFLIPVRPGFRDWAMGWAALDGLALLLPLVAAAVGLAVALAPRLPAAARAGALAATGTAGLLLGIAPLGEYAATAERPLYLATLGMLVAGAALVVRVSRPRDRDSRYAIAAGAALLVVGLVIPVAETGLALPGEYRLSMDPDALADAAPLGVYTDGILHQLLIRLLSLLSLLPVVVLPVAAVMAWAPPGGVWDRSGVALRPIGWLVVLFVPILHAFLIFNMTGWNLAWVRYDGYAGPFDPFGNGVMAVRAKLVLLSAAYALFAQLGAAALHQQLRGGAEVEPNAAPARVIRRTRP